MPKTKQPRYFLEPLPLTPETSPKVALECFVKTCGDTWGIAKILHAGGIEFWRLGKRTGRFATFNQLYRQVDKIL